MEPLWKNIQWGFSCAADFLINGVAAVALKMIFSRNDYRIMVDHDERRACIIKGKNTLNVTLEELTPLSPVAAKHLRLMGCEPANYLNIGFTNQVILKEAASAWQQALETVASLTRKKDSSMIPTFWNNLTGLLELREAEDSFAACQRTASMMFEYGERSGPPSSLQELRKRYPRAAAYILAESHAFSADERVAGRARRAMHLIASNGNIDRALELLPRTPPNLQHEKRRREPDDE